MQPDNICKEPGCYQITPHAHIKEGACTAGPNIDPNDFLTFQHKIPTGIGEGLKYDQGKNRLELVHPIFVEATAEIATMGAKKYADWNWYKGIKYSRIIGGILRHLFAWIRGERIDPESGKSHLWHANNGMMFLTVFEAEGRTELDDLPKKGEK